MEGLPALCENCLGNFERVVAGGQADEMTLRTGSSIDSSMNSKKAGFWVPALYSKKGRNDVGKVDYRYNAEIILNFSDQFLELHNRLNEITSAMGEWHRIAASQRMRERTQKT